MEKVVEKRIIVLIISLMILLSGVIVILYNRNPREVILNEKKQEQLPDSLSIMVETGLRTGTYEISNTSSWPEDYVFNETLSKCEKGSKITWDIQTQSLAFSFNTSDKCYVYFDVPLPDLLTTVQNMPETVGKQGTLNCSSGNVTWNQKYQQLELSGTDKSECSLTFEETSPVSQIARNIKKLAGTQNSETPLNEYIISLSGQTQGDGKVVLENGYRYEGKNPNNYVWFNNELWRIIGVFGAESHGQSGKSLVKIIRNSSIAIGIAWDNAHTNDWVNSSLKAILNGAYYNYTIDTENCYGADAITATCDYRRKGIQSNYQGMIENVTWYLGGGGKEGYTTYTPDSIYEYERNSNAVYSGRSASTTGKIGLMYESDYLYGVLASDCARTTDHGSYAKAKCAGKDWLYGQGNEWTISPRSISSEYLWSVFHDGRVILCSAIDGYAVRPVLYLSSSVYKVSGSGTKANPYIIGM